MDDRFGPFSECAKQHVAVKPQKGEVNIPSLNKLPMVQPHMLIQHI